MSQSPENRIMALVHACAGMSDEERDSYLARECGADRGLLESVRAILLTDRNETGIHDSHADYQRVLPPYYRLIGILGSGGMANVYLAEDTRLNRRVAIKFLKDVFSRDHERMLRFVQEARSASALNHPNIITIHDIGELDGVQYIVSEYVEGETLGSRIARGRLSLDDTLEIAIQIASALRAAHGAGVIHRDLKPDNIMLRSDGSVKVVDFGLAKGSDSGLGSSHDGTTLAAITTHPGTILGTPRYMSPEQTRGVPLDARSDIFSLGLIIFEMLTQHSPFGGDSLADVIAAVIGKEPRRLSDYIAETHAGIEHVINKALEKHRDDRYQTADEMLSDLREIRRDVVGSSGISSGFRSGRTASGLVTSEQPRRSNWKWLVAACIVAAALGAIWLFALGGAAKPAVATTLRTVPITSWSSVSGESVAASAFSPDARMVAFASTRSGATEIWVKPTAGGEAIQVTKNAAYNQYPVWSPDSQEIAFFSSRGDTHGLWRISFTGGAETQVLGGVSASARCLRWGADKKIYFDDGQQIFAVDAASGVRQPVLDIAALSIRPRTTAISPNGGTVALSVKEADGWKLKTVDVASKALALVATSVDRVDSIQFNSDGQTLFYNSLVDGVQQIFSVALKKGQPAQLSNGSGDSVLQDVSSDGSKILYASLSESSDLWVVDAADGKTSVVANDVAEEYWADVSPDSKSVVYQSVPLPERPFRGEVFVKALASEDRLLRVSDEGFLPVWSQDGQWIAYFRRTDVGMNIWKVRATGADAVRISAGDAVPPGYTNVPYLQTGIGHIGWTPDGKAVAYSAKVDGVSNIWLAAADGSGTSTLTDNHDPNATLANVAWTPDGAFAGYTVDTKPPSGQGRLRALWLGGAHGEDPHSVFESGADYSFLGFASSGEAVIAEKADPAENSLTPTATNISLVPRAGGQPLKVNVLSNAYFFNIRLSRRGDMIGFVTRANNVSTIWTVPTAGGTPKKVLAENDPKMLISRLSWSPDGRSIVFGKQTRTNVLSMLTN